MGEKAALASKPSAFRCHINYGRSAHLVVGAGLVFIAVQCCHGTENALEHCTVNKSKPNVARLFTLLGPPNNLSGLYLLADTELRESKNIGEAPNGRNTNDTLFLQLLCCWSLRYTAWPECDSARSEEKSLF